MAKTETVKVLRTVLIERSGDVLMLKAIYGQPCRGFENYRAFRSPACGCLPCLNKYVERMRDEGREIVEVSNG